MSFMFIFSDFLPVSVFHSAGIVRVTVCHVVSTICSPPPLWLQKASLHLCWLRIPSSWPRPSLKGAEFHPSLPFHSLWKPAIWCAKAKKAINITRNILYIYTYYIYICIYTFYVNDIHKVIWSFTPISSPAEPVLGIWQNDLIGAAGPSEITQRWRIRRYCRTYLHLLPSHICWLSRDHCDIQWSQHITLYHNISQKCLKASRTYYMCRSCHVSQVLDSAVSVLQYPFVTFFAGQWFHMIFLSADGPPSKQIQYINVHASCASLLCVVLVVLVHFWHFLALFPALNRQRLRSYDRTPRNSGLGRFWPWHHLGSARKRKIGPAMASDRQSPKSNSFEGSNCNMFKLYLIMSNLFKFKCVKCVQTTPWNAPQTLGHLPTELKKFI